MARRRIKIIQEAINYWREQGSPDMSIRTRRTIKGVVYSEEEFARLKMGWWHGKDIEEDRSEIPERYRNQPYWDE